MKRRIEQGEAFDLAVLVDFQTDDLIKRRQARRRQPRRRDDGPASASRCAAARPSRTSGTVEAFKRTLLRPNRSPISRRARARSISIKVFAQLGIAEALKAKTIQPMTEVGVRDGGDPARPSSASSSSPTSCRCRAPSWSARFRRRSSPTSCSPRRCRRSRPTSRPRASVIRLLHQPRRRAGRSRRRAWSRGNPRCHCERSEAIPLRLLTLRGMRLLRYARNDGYCSSAFLIARKSRQASRFCSGWRSR